MNSQILKTGVANANMVVGANLLPLTSNVEQQFTYPASSYSDKYSKKTIIVPSATQYTLSFYAKSTVAGDKIRSHFYSPNTTTKSESSQSVVTTNSDGYMYYTLSTQWERYWVVYTQSTTTSTKTIICPRLYYSEGTGTVSIKCVKLEEGAHPTPWIACVNDANYVGTSCGFFESPVNQAKIYKELYEANQFYEI